KIRQVLKDDPEQPRFVQTITGRGYRFIASVEEVVPPSAAPIVVELPALANSEAAEGAPEKLARGKSSLRWKLLVLAVALITIGTVLESFYLKGRRADRLNAQDTIVLGDFANSTGDPIFDDTLKQGLTLTLRQSPFLNILSQSKVSKTLRLMPLDPASALPP